MRVRLIGDTGVQIDYGDGPAAHFRSAVLELDRRIGAARLAGVIELVPAYNSLLVIFDPCETSGELLSRQIEELAGSVPGSGAHIGAGIQRRATRTWRIPVAYGGVFGPDLGEVAGRLGLEVDAVIALHAGARYVVSMLGFLPGFAYLSGLPARLAVPRRATPRPLAPPGIIAIGGAQTAVGSVAGPSGWSIIGRTPLRTFDPQREPASLLAPGDGIVFEPVCARTFEALSAAGARGGSVSHAGDLPVVA
ncbi:MAG: 5-oxoprolinase subunit PxpB [Hyphomicrobiaceae bacterium]